MNCFEALNKVEATSKTNEKISILRDFADDSVMCALIERCFNYKRIYFIKDLPDPQPGCVRQENPLWFDEFLGLLDECGRRGRTQETKQLMANWLACQGPDIDKWCRRVLLRDLKCGVSQEIALKAGFKFPTFEVMLATDGKKCKKLMELVARGLYVSPKFDGYRCFAIVRDGTVSLYSRNGTKFENFPQIEQALLKTLGWAGDRCYDGEIMSNDFNSMQQSAFASKRGTVVGDVGYCIFGTVPIDEWDSQEFKTTYEENRQKLLDIFAYSPCENSIIHILSQPVPKDATREDLIAIEMGYIEAGYEGAICNPGDTPYYMGKQSNKMIKLKEFKSQDCKVIRANPGEGKREGVLGSLTVLQENGVECDVGSGFNDEELADLWDRSDELIDRVIEVAYQELTPDGVMRFPVFKKWRPDKEKA